MQEHLQDLQGQDQLELHEVAHQEGTQDQHQGLGRLYGHHRTHMVEPIYYHKCPFCQKDILLDADDIHKHVGTHGVKLKDYNAKFIVSVWNKEQDDESQDGLGLDNDTRKAIGDLFDSI